MIFLFWIVCLSDDISGIEYRTFLSSQITKLSQHISLNFHLWGIYDYYARTRLLLSGIRTFIWSMIKKSIHNCENTWMITIVMKMIEILLHIFPVYLKDVVISPCKIDKVIVCLPLIEVLQITSLSFTNKMILQNWF